MFALSQVRSRWVAFALVVLLGLSLKSTSSLARNPDRALGAVDVVRRVEAQSTIISIVPVGTEVKRGQLVCEFSATGLHDALRGQRTVVKAAEAGTQAARKYREAVEASLREYNETFLDEELEAKREIVAAEAELARANDRVEWATRMWGQGKVEQGSRVAEELSFQRAKFGIELAQSRLVVLQNHTRPRILRNLQGDVEKSHSGEQIRQSVLRLEQARENRIQQQIDACRILAPIDGTVLDARPDRRSTALEAEFRAGELANLRDELDQQKIAVQAAMSDHRLAGNRCQVAEMALREYSEGTLFQELGSAQREIKQAESELVREKEVLTWAKRMVVKGLLAMPEKVIEDHRLEKADSALEQARQKKKSIQADVRGRTMKRLRSQVEMDRTEQQASETAWELERAREARIQSQIERCLTSAPIAPESNPRQDAAPGSVPGPAIRVGSPVPQGRLLIRIAPPQ